MTTNTHIYTSDKIVLPNGETDEHTLGNILESLCHTSTPIKYQLTSSELKWLDAAKGILAIADYINDTMDGDVFTLEDASEMSEVLDSDCKDSMKALMLSNNSALQHIFVTCYQDEDFR